MAYAQYTNQEVVYRPYLPLIAGCFREVEHSKAFEYAIRKKTDKHAWLSSDEFPHVIFVGPESVMRYARVLKTVAYIVVDEDENGEPVVEKWHIKSHQKYDISKYNK